MFQFLIKLFTEDEEVEEVKPTHCPPPPMNHNLLKKRLYKENAFIQLIASEKIGPYEFRLYKVRFDVGTWSKIMYVLNLKYIDDDNEFTIRHWYDDDVEYAENCAMEAFDYISKII